MEGLKEDIVGTSLFCDSGILDSKKGFKMECHIFDSDFEFLWK